MIKRNRVEIYNSVGLLSSVDTSIVPFVGSFINIEGKTWRVARVTFAVDYSGQPFERMRANVDVEDPEKPTRQTAKRRKSAPKKVTP